MLANIKEDFKFLKCNTLPKESFINRSIIIKPKTIFYKFVYNELKIL